MKRATKLVFHEHRIVCPYCRTALIFNSPTEVIRACVGRRSRITIRAMNDKQLLERLDRGEKLSSANFVDLRAKGLIKIRDVTSHSSAPGEKEYLFISFTAEGERVLKGR